MLPTIQSVFEQVRPELPTGLSQRIFTTIETLAAERARFRARVAAWCAFLSLAVFFVSLIIAGNSFLASDFWQLASFLFSDFSLVIASSGVFLASLAETFPAASAAFLIAPIFFYATALAFRSRYLDIETQSRHPQLTTAHLTL